MSSKKWSAVYGNIEKHISANKLLEGINICIATHKPKGIMLIQDKTLLEIYTALMPMTLAHTHTHTYATQ
jgi:hypothetical protein